MTNITRKRSDAAKIVEAMTIAQYILHHYSNPISKGQADDVAIVALALEMLDALVGEDFLYPMDDLLVEVEAHRLLLWRNATGPDADFFAARHHDNAAIARRADELGPLVHYV